MNFLLYCILFHFVGTLKAVPQFVYFFIKYVDGSEITSSGWIRLEQHIRLSSGVSGRILQHNLPYIQHRRSLDLLGPWWLFRHIPCSGVTSAYLLRFLGMQLSRYRIDQRQIHHLHHLRRLHHLHRHLLRLLQHLRQLPICEIVIFREINWKLINC